MGFFGSAALAWGEKVERVVVIVLQPTALHAAAGAGHNHRGVLRQVRVADGDRRAALTTERQRIISEQVHGIWTKGIPGVVVETLLSLIGVLVASDVSGRQSVFPRIAHHVIDRHAVTVGDVAYPA